MDCASGLRQSVELPSQYVIWQLLEELLELWNQSALTLHFLPDCLVSRFFDCRLNFCNCFQVTMCVLLDRIFEI